MWLGDQIWVLLGSHFPIILRRTEYGYRFISRGLIHGVMDGEALLGSLPISWKIHAEYARECVSITYAQGDDIYKEDPRLDDLPEGEAFEWIRFADSSSYGVDYCVGHWFSKKSIGFFNKIEQKKIINSDPRLQPDELKTRELPLQTIRLE